MLDRFVKVCGAKKITITILSILLLILKSRLKNYVSRDLNYSYAVK